MRANVVIEKVLRDNVHSDVSPRDSDKELTIQVMEHYGLWLSETQKAKFRNLPFALESIRRTRQKFQEQGQYTASQFVRRHRKFKSMEVQQKMPQTAPEKVQGLIENTDHQQEQASLL